MLILTSKLIARRHMLKKAII